MGGFFLIQCREDAVQTDEKKSTYTCRFAEKQTSNPVEFSTLQDLSIQIHYKTSFDQLSFQSVQKSKVDFQITIDSAILDKGPSLVVKYKSVDGEEASFESPLVQPKAIWKYTLALDNYNQKIGDDTKGSKNCNGTFPTGVVESAGFKVVMKEKGSLKITIAEVCDVDNPVTYGTASVSRDGKTAQPPQVLRSDTKNFRVLNSELNAGEWEVVFSGAINETGGSTGLKLDAYFLTGLSIKATAPFVLKLPGTNDQDGMQIGTATSE